MNMVIRDIDLDALYPPALRRAAAAPSTQSRGVR
jgi:hypothetical protein